MKVEGSQSILSKDSKKYQKKFHYMMYVTIIGAIIFALLITSQIVNIQIINQSYYANILNSARQTISTQPPRGRIFDRNGVLLAGNEQDIQAQYYPIKELTADEKWSLAQKFAKQFNVIGELTEREEKDLYMFLHRKTIINEKLSDSEKKDKQLDDSDINKLVLSRISEEERKTLTQEQKNAFRVQIGMNYATSSRMGVVKRDLTSEEAAYLIEHKSEFPGFDVEYEWKRVYPKGDLFKSVIGKISNQIQGLPSEDSVYLIHNGYNLNDRIGISGLEKQYESILSGTKNIYELSSSDSKTLNKKVVQKGQAGSDIYLTIDSRLQEKLNQVLADALQSQKVRSDKLSTMMVSITDVNTGALFGLASQTLDKENNRNSSYDSASETYLSGFSPGSSVKGATIYMGLDQGVVSPGEVILDAPLYIAGTPVKKSFRNFGPINEVQALQVSSNVYMFHIVMRMGGATYVPQQSILLKESIIDDMRQYYTSFGLGALTNLDVPNELLAYTGTARNTSNSLDYAIGQYDQYTLIQLAQYSNTIATRGVRLRPYLVSKAVNNNVETIINSATIDGYVPGNHRYFDNVIRGFVATGTTFKGQPVAYKTGTADVETHYTSNTVVSFAPVENPKISIACAAPFAVNERTTSNITNPCAQIVQKTYEAYNELYPFR